MTGNVFRAFRAAGFTELLPILPPDAAVSPGSAISDANRGKVPGRRNQDGTWAGVTGWRTKIASDAELDAWHASGAGVGLRLGRWIAFDLDEDDPGVADALGRALAGILGVTAIRGRPGAARRLYLCRPDKPVPKTTLEWEVAGRRGKLEILCEGQQCVLYGPHKSGSRYTWNCRSPREVMAAVQPFATGRIGEVEAAIVAALEALGGTLVAQRRGLRFTGRGAVPIVPFDLTPEYRAEVVKAMALLPCGGLDYDPWIAHMAAIKRAVGGDADFFATEVLKWTEDFPDNTPEEVQARWDSFASTIIGAEWLFWQAELAGYAGAGTALLDFPPLTAAELEAAAIAAKHRAAKENQRQAESWANRWVYILAVERYVDLDTMQMLTETAFKRALVQHGHPSAGKDNAAMRWQMLPEARKLASLTYRPGGKRFIREDGLDCLNTWRPADIALPAAVTDSDVTPWLEHAAYLLPDPGERALALDWMAYRLQRLDAKANFALIFGGEEGIGKNLLFSVLRHGLGGRNVKGVDQADVDGQWTDWAGNCVLVVIEEIHHFGKSLINKIKKYITVPPETVRINVKGIPQYEVPNAAAFLAYTNNLDALQLDQTDRRWLVLWSHAEPRDEAYYGRLAGWLASGGMSAAVRWLLQRDLSAFNASGRAPSTAAKAEMREMAAHPVEQWVVMAVRERIPPFATDLVTAEKALEQLPRHLTVHKPTNKRVLAGLRAAGAVALGQFRLGLSVGAGDRARIWAVRSAAKYQDREPAWVALTYHTQHSGMSPLTSHSTVDSEDDLGGVGTKPN